MLNVLGDSWPEGGNPNWSQVLQESDAHMHLYGKLAARPGRKMGHINCLGDNREQAMAVATLLRQSLQV